jgi:lysophospholipase L1-like esterase
LGDSHARGMANELQHRLRKSFEVQGIVKPGANIKEITNTLNLTVSSLTKKDGCIVWGRTRDIVKNEGQNGLRQMKDFVTRQNHTDLLLINATFRHDLQESSCVNSAVKNFNRKLMKYNKAFENLHLLEVENCRELYTIHGLHLNGKGKEVTAEKIVNVIKDILNVKRSYPIGIK